jgi:hypothetical protein
VSDEIKAAAERLTENCWDTYLAGDPHTRDWHRIFDAAMLDGRNVARAYLAEHDDTPIDEAWLRSAGLKHSDGGWYVTIASGPNRLYWVGGLVSISRDGHKHVSLCTGINTRGQLLRLCQALGIPRRAHPRAATETEPATFRQGYPRTPK